MDTAREEIRGRGTMKDDEHKETKGEERERVKTAPKAKGKGLYKKIQSFTN